MMGMREERGWKDEERGGTIAKFPHNQKEIINQHRNE
jgi:hypothetical protein